MKGKGVHWLIFRVGMAFFVLRELGLPLMLAAAFAVMDLATLILVSRWAEDNK